MVGQHGATGAAFLPFRAEHEVIHNRLAALIEQVGKGHLSARAVEDVVLLDLLPRQFTALPA
jgi:hypothetical protein